MTSIDPRALRPPGLVVEAVERTTDTIIITADQERGHGACPACGEASDSVHSLQRRRLRELPAHGHAVEMLVHTRGRARRGHRLRARAPFARWGTQTFITALRADRLTCASAAR